MKTSPETHVPLTGYANLPEDDMLARALAFHDRMAGRRSVREFSDKPVPREIIEACVRTAGSAPSGANHQPWYFACVGSAEKKREIREAAEAEEREFYSGRAGEEWLDALAPIGTDADKPYMETAPWLICIFAQRRGGVRDGEDRKNYYIHESVGIATGLLIAACHEAGLATLVHTPNPMKFLNGICGRPETEKPFLILVAGHPAEGAMVPKHALIKKPMGEIASFL
jgi:nitroreductase